MSETIEGKVLSSEVKIDVEVQHELDTRGLFCPEPVMLLHNKVRDMSSGDVVRVLATDPSTQRDIPKFCHFLDHELLEKQTCDDRFVYLVRKH